LVPCGDVYTQLNIPYLLECKMSFFFSLSLSLKSGA